MILTSLQLRNYRNYDSFQMSFDNNIYVIFGKNGQGKTNILEAISYISSARSFRCKDEYLIQEGYDVGSIKCEYITHEKLSYADVVISSKGKFLSFNKTPLHKVSDFIGNFSCVLFSPSDLNLFHDAPRIRRRFIDMEIGKLSKSYVQHLSLYNKLLKERNAALKSKNINKDYIDTLTDKMIDEIIVITKKRREFFDELLEICNPFYQKISKDETVLSFTYVACIDDSENIKEQLKEMYEKSFEKDCFLKQTTIGIHKEDFHCEIEGRLIETFLSQGQMRSVLLGIKIGLVYMIYREKKEYPVILLDDVFSELDETRSSVLFDSLPEESQIFITTTSPIKFKKSNKKVVEIEIEKGKLKEVLAHE